MGRGMPEIILSIQKRLQKGQTFSDEERTRLLASGYSVDIDKLTDSHKIKLEQIADDIHAELKDRYGGEYSHCYDYVAKWSGYNYREAISYYTIREVLVGLRKNDEEIPIYRMRYICDIEEGDVLCIKPLTNKYGDVLWETSHRINRSIYGYGSNSV